MTDETERLTVEEIRTAVARMQRELDKHDGGPYGVLFERDFGTVVATAQQWLTDFDQQFTPTPTPEEASE